MNNIISKLINVDKEKCRTTNVALRNSIINWIFLYKLPIQKYLKLSITKNSEKRPNTRTEIAQDLNFWRKLAY